jgi:hypothetical protein
MPVTSLNLSPAAVWNTPVTPRKIASDEPEKILVKKSSLELDADTVDFAQSQKKTGLVAEQASVVDPQQLEENKAIHGGKIKGAFMAAIPALAGLAMTFGAEVLEGAKDAAESNRSELTSNLIALLGVVGFGVTATSLLVPLGYLFFEKPESDAFNKKL